MNYCCVEIVLCRYLLGFGTVSQYVGYNALSDFFPTMKVRPNPQCSNSHCVLQQDRYKEFLITHPPSIKEEAKEESVVHESNEWGKIIIVPFYKDCSSNRNCSLAFSPFHVFFCNVKIKFKQGQQLTLP